MQDDAAQYVIHRGLKEAGKGHPLAVSSLGEIEELEGLTLEDMRQTHQALLEGAAGSRSSSAAICRKRRSVRCSVSIFPLSRARRRQIRIMS